MKQPFERSVSLIRSCVERGLIPSAALAMGVGDEVMVKECWGVTSVTEDAQPVNSQTLYDMASVSKIYATTMITLRFIERGILDLADMLPRYFGDLVPEDKQHITIFHLLTHTSGYPDHILLHTALTDPEETVPFLLKTPLNGKERCFCILAYLPKATVQAAIGSVPLTMGLACGPMVLSVAVLAILVTAPAGALGMDATYRRLLNGRSDRPAP